MYVLHIYYIYVYYGYLCLAVNAILWGMSGSRLKHETCVFLCVCVRVCVRVYVCLCIWTFRKYTYRYIYMYVCVSAYIHVYVHRDASPQSIDYTKPQLTTTTERVVT